MSDLIQKDKYEQDYVKYEKLLKSALEEEKEQRIIKDTKRLQKFIDEDFMSIYDTLTDEEKQRFWRTIIENIKISGKDKIEVKILD